MWERGAGRRTIVAKMLDCLNSHLNDGTCPSNDYAEDPALYSKVIFAK